MSEFCMPSLGADMDEGTLLEWLVKPGDAVAKGDIVAVVDTAKSAVDVETFESGVVQEILVQPGTRVPVGTPLALIGAEVPVAAAAVEEPVQVPKQRKAAKPRKAAAKPAARATQKRQPTRRPKPEQERERAPQPTPAAVAPPVASPVVRRFAQAAGVELAGVHGTGVGGRITHEDVRREMGDGQAGVTARARISPYARRRARELGIDPADLRSLGVGHPVRAADVEAVAAGRGEPRPTPVGPAAATAPAPAPAAPAPVSAPTAAERTAAMRRAIATLMARSKREIPHYYLTETLDLSVASTWLQRHNAPLPVGERVVMAALLAKATALAAHRIPDLNGFWVDDGFRPADAVHLGVAVSLRGGGLVTPAIHDAAALSVPDLMAAMRDLVERARRGVLHRAELTEGTITVTNLGERGAESVQGVIFPPQVALVGFGRVLERPVAVGGLVGVHPIVVATLSGDHRASDGHVGGRFLTTVADLMNKPEEL